MPNPNALVSNAVRLDPPLDRAASEMLRDRGLSVELEGGRRVPLDPTNPRSAGYAQILDELSKQGLPVYVEVDPVTSALVRLRIPFATRVRAMEAGEEGELRVELERSHAVHRLNLGAPDFRELEQKLRDALRTGAAVLVTDGDAHEIIDVRETARDPGGVIPPFPKPPREDPYPWGRWLSWLLGLFQLGWSVSRERAWLAFDAMSATSCDPLSVPAPCIPFQYPDNGCWARAHQMARLLIDRGLTPRKVWNWPPQGQALGAATSNHPGCFIYWTYHVAPTLLVRGPGFFQTETVVIDPALFTSPVPLETWKAAQGNANSTLTEGPAAYYHWYSYDPDYEETAADLARFRIELRLRALDEGPPPYMNCMAVQ